MTNDERPAPSAGRRPPRPAPDADRDPIDVGSGPQASVHAFPGTPDQASSLATPLVTSPKRDITVQVNTRLGLAYGDLLDRLKAQGLNKRDAIENALKQTYGLEES